MAILSGIAAAISRSVRAYIAGGRLTAREIADRVASRWEVTEATDRARVHLLIQQQIDATVTAEEMQANNSYRPGSRDLPIDWSAYGAGAKYSYTVRIDYSNLQLGDSGDYLYIVESDTPLTANEAVSRARQSGVSFGQSRSYIGPGVRAEQGYQFDYTLIAAGRTP